MIKHFQKETQEKSLLDGYLFHAFILKTAPFRGKKEIYTLFTKEQGIFPCIFNKQFSPFQEIEAAIKKKDEGLSTCSRMDLIDPLLGLRLSFESMNAAAGLVQALEAAQMQHCPNPELFDVSLSFLKRMAASLHPKALLASFLLKLLRKDGILNAGLAGFSEDEKKTALFLLEATTFASIEKISLSGHLFEKIHNFFKRHLL